MAACKIALAVALVMSANLAQINGRPADTDWATPFQATLKNITSTMGELAGENSHKYADLAKNSYNEFVGTFKSGLTTLSETFQSNPGVSKVVKEAAKKWEEAVNTYSKNLPEDLNPGNLAEKYEKSLKYITDHATELAKKADGNKDLEKEIIEFTKTQIDNLMTQVQTVKSKLSETKA